MLARRAVTVPGVSSTDVLRVTWKRGGPGSGGGIFAAMKKLFFIGACLVALVSQPVMAQTGAPDLVVVKVDETPSFLRFSIARGQQEPEEVQINLGKAMKVSVAYYTTLSKFYAQGYVVQALIPGIVRANWIESTLILGKPVSKP